MPDRTVKWTIPLYYQPAFFASFIESETLTPAIKIWLQHPAELNYCQDPEYLLTLQLGNTPSTVMSPEFVEVDDHVNCHRTPGFTTLGPQFPLAYATGAVYVSQNTLEKNHNYATGLVPPDHIAIVQRLSDGTTRRYHGFVAIRFPQDRGEPSGQLWLVYHPGSGTVEAGRAPRKLLVPNDYILPMHCIPSSLRLEPLYSRSTNAVYLDQKYIEHVALLEIPKKPSTAGALIVRAANTDGEAQAPGVSARPPSPHGEHLNVLGATSYGELDNIEVALRKNFLKLGDGDTLFDALKWYSDHYPADLEQFTSIDLIGHARAADHVLKLGEFTLTSRNAASEFSRLAESEILARFPRVRLIRLLGCQTACSARARRVVATIKAFCPDLDVAASRADLYAIHFDGSGLRRQAEALLAYDKVITGSGPGDPPPGSDRPLPAPPDDDDDDDIGWPQSAVPLPSRFDFGALSDVNAPATAAHRFVYWASAKEKFANLQALLHTEWPTKAKPLRRADYEILLQIDSPATSIEDFRSFDILLGDKPSVRVYTSDGAAYSFRFRDANAAKVKEDLNNCASIDLACAQSLPEPRARQRESPITQRKPSP